VSVTIAGAAIGGTPVEPVNGKAVVAIRPEDLVATPDGPISAVVEAAEYRGRDFYGFARAGDGTELFFRAEVRLQAGETVRLAAPAERVLVYAGGLV
jgi:putative spermidine/putrescine transport system ATP-binding protein